MDDIAGPLFGRHHHQFLSPILFPAWVTLIAHDLATFSKRRSCDCLRYINACYVDIDFHRLGLDFGTVIGRVFNWKGAGELPHASFIVRSGHWVWLLWLIHDIKTADLSQRAFPDKLELYSRIQAAIVDRLLPLSADMAARDAAGHLRIPGSLNSGSETNVEWWTHGANESGHIYTLSQLAKLFSAIPTKRHHREIVAHNPAKRRGWVLSTKGFGCNHQTAFKDYKALGIKRERTRGVGKDRKSTPPAPRPGSHLLYAEISGQDLPPESPEIGLMA